MAGDEARVRELPAAMTDEMYDRYVSCLARDFAPRRFVLIGVAADRTDAGVLGWGIAWEDEALTYLTGPGHDSRFSLFVSESAQSVRATLGIRHEVRLAWIDTEP